jgi:hypothetical protein
MKVPYSCKKCGRYWLREEADAIRCAYYMWCTCGASVKSGLDNVLNIWEEVEA